MQGMSALADLIEPSEPLNDAEANLKTAHDTVVAVASAKLPMKGQAAKPTSAAVQTVPKLLARKTAQDPNIVYRILRAQEPGIGGITPKSPGSTASALEHVLHGSDPEFGSNFISTTRDLGFALRWAAKNDASIAVIDLRRLPSLSVVTQYDGLVIVWDEGRWTLPRSRNPVKAEAESSRRNEP